VDKNLNPRKTHPEWMEETPLFGMISRILRNENAFASGHVGAAVEKLTGTKFPYDDADLKLTQLVHWAAYQWVESDRPIFRMSQELASALINTDLPAEELEELPNMPYNGIYIDAPEAFDVYNKHTGLHRGEGVLLCRDLVRLPEDEATEGPPTLTPAIAVIVVGEDKNAHQSKVIRDDALLYCFIVAGKPIIGEAFGDYEGIIEGLRLGLNMLFLWNSDANVTGREVRPRTPKSPKKLKKLDRQGRSVRRYFYLDLKNAWGRSRRQEATQWDGSTHEAVVCGHFRRYWVMPPVCDAQVLKTKNDNGREMCCIRKFIKPFKAIRRGEKPTRNVREVRR
jgi:hypothetical protein